MQAMINEIDAKSNPKEFDIRFEYINELGDYFEMRTRANGIHEMGELVELGACFNQFLKQLTFPREKDLLFMEDIDDDEYDFLTDALEKYRNGNAEEEE